MSATLERVTALQEELERFIKHMDEIGVMERADNMREGDDDDLAEIASLATELAITLVPIVVELQHAAASGKRGSN